MLSILVIFFAAIALGASAAEVPVGPPSRAWQRSLQSATSQGWPIPIGREGLLAQDDAKTIYLFSRVSSRPLWIVPFAELLIPGVAFGVDILLNASEFQGPEPLLYVAGPKCVYGIKALCGAVAWKRCAEGATFAYPPQLHRDHIIMATFSVLMSFSSFDGTPQWSTASYRRTLCKGDFFAKPFTIGRYTPWDAIIACFEDPSKPDHAYTATMNVQTGAVAFEHHFGDRGVSVEAGVPIICLQLSDKKPLVIVRVGVATQPRSIVAFSPSEATQSVWEYKLSNVAKMMIAAGERLLISDRTTTVASLQASTGKLQWTSDLPPQQLVKIETFDLTLTLDSIVFEVVGRNSIFFVRGIVGCTPPFTACPRSLISSVGLDTGTAGSALVVPIEEVVAPVSLSGDDRIVFSATGSRLFGFNTQTAAVEVALYTFHPAWSLSWDNSFFTFGTSASIYCLPAKKDEVMQ